MEERQTTLQNFDDSTTDTKDGHPVFTIKDHDPECDVCDGRGYRNVATQNGNKRKIPCFAGHNFDDAVDTE